MIENKNGTKGPHNLILKNRKALSISGALDVDSFDESEVVAYTELGELTIKGQNLHINKIDLDSGDIELDGEIYALEYLENQISKKSFFSRLFK